MPITYGVKRNVISMPLLTQKLGPYIVYPLNQSNAKRLSFENEIICEILKRLPKVDEFNVNFNYTYTNWLPFYWAGFKQTTRYTYLIDNLDNDVFSRFVPAKRTDIRKALELIEIRNGLSGVDFINFYIDSLHKQGKRLSYNQDLFLRIYNAAIHHGSGDIIWNI